MLEIVSGWINLLCNISKKALHILKWGLGSRDAGSFKILRQAPMQPQICCKVAWLPNGALIDGFLLCYDHRIIIKLASIKFIWGPTFTASQNRIALNNIVTAKRKLERLQFSTSSSFVKIWSPCSCEFKAYFWTFRPLYHLLFDQEIIGVN